LSKYKGIPGGLQHSGVEFYALTFAIVIRITKIKANSGISLCCNHQLL